MGHSLVRVSETIGYARKSENTIDRVKKSPQHMAAYDNATRTELFRPKKLIFNHFP